MTTHVYLIKLRHQGFHLFLQGGKLKCLLTQRAFTVEEWAELLGQKGEVVQYLWNYMEKRLIELQATRNATIETFETQKQFETTAQHCMERLTQLCREIRELEKELSYRYDKT